MKTHKIVGKTNEAGQVQWELVAPMGCAARAEQVVASVLKIVVWVTLGILLGLIISGLI
jgi:hypothetical protein